jgi:hypothetical protein
MRPPVLLAGDFRGLAIPDSRGTRLEVDDAGALVLVRREGPPVRLAEPGAIDRVTPIEARHLHPGRFVPPIHVGLVAFWAGERLVAAVSWGQVWASGFNLTLAELQHASGLERVAEALGTVVDAPTPSDLQCARGWGRTDVLTLIEPAVLPARGAAAQSVAIFVLALGTLPATGAWWLQIPALAAVSLPVFRFWRLRREFRRLVTTEPPPGDRVVVRPRPAGPSTRLVLDSSLQVGPQHVVLRHGAAEWWLLGPARRGVSSVDVHPDLWVVRDVGGRQVLTLDATAWGDVAGFAAACRSAGVDLREVPVPFSGPNRRIDGPRTAAARGWPQGDALVNGDTGLVVSSMRHVAVFLVFLSSLLAITRYEWFATPILLWGVVLVWLSMDGIWRREGWVRSLRRTVDDRPEASPGTQRPDSTEEQS